MPPAPRVTSARATQSRSGTAQRPAAPPSRKSTAATATVKRCPQSLDLLAVAPSSSTEQARSASACRSVAAHEIRTESLPPCMSSAEVLEMMSQATLRVKHTMPLFTSFTTQTLCLGVDANESAALHADTRNASDASDVPLYNLLVTVQPTRRSATQFFKYLQRLPGVPEQLQKSKGKDSKAATTDSHTTRRSRRVVRQCWTQLDKAGLRGAAFYQRVSLDAATAKSAAQRRSHSNVKGKAAHAPMTLSLAHLTWANRQGHEVESDESTSHSNLASSSLPPLPLIHISSLSETHVRVQEATRLLATCVSLITCAAHPRHRSRTAASAGAMHNETTTPAVRIRIWLDLAYLLEANTRIAADLHDALHTAAVNCLALPHVQEVVDLRYSTCQEAGLDGSGQSEVFAAFSVAYCCDVITLRRPTNEVMPQRATCNNSSNGGGAASLAVPSHSASATAKQNNSSTHDESTYDDKAEEDAKSSSSSSTCDSDSLGASSLFFTRESDKPDEDAPALAALGEAASSNTDPSFLAAASDVKGAKEKTSSPSLSHKRPREHTVHEDNNNKDDVPLAVLYSQPQSWATPLSAHTDDHDTQPSVPRDLLPSSQQQDTTSAGERDVATTTMTFTSQPPPLPPSPPAPCACLFVEACALVPMVTTDTQAAIAEATDRLRRVLVRWCDLLQDCNKKNSSSNRTSTGSADVAARRLVVLLTRSVQELVAVLLAWTLRPCAEHALLVPLFGVAEESTAASTCDLSQHVEYVLHAFALQPSLCYGVCVSAEGVAAMQRCLPAAHVVCLDKDSVADAAVEATVAGWSAKASASITDTLSLVSALAMHNHSEEEVNNNALLQWPSTSTVAEQVFVQYCSWSSLAQSLRHTPRRPEVVLHKASPYAGRAWYTGLVRPATLHALTFAPATSRETRLLLRQATTLRLSQAQWTSILRRLADFFTPTQFRTAIDVVRTSEADYFMGYVCAATGYMRYEVASWVRRFVRVELSTDLCPLLRLCEAQSPAAEDAVTHAVTTANKDEVCDWDVVLPRLTCSCVPRAHEVVLRSAAGQKRCRHMAELLYYFLTRQVTLQHVS